MAAPSFGLVCEGLTDQHVLASILRGVFGKDTAVTRILPPYGESGELGVERHSNWDAVLKYWGSIEMKQALGFLDFLVVQIDSDACEDYSVPRRVEGREKTIDELRMSVSERLIDEIGQDFFTQTNRIILAVCVDSLERWLLPLYYSDKKAAKHVNCLGTLNQALKSKEKFTIDTERKDHRYYMTIGKQFEKPSRLAECAPRNESLAIFFNALAQIKLGLDRYPTDMVSSADSNRIMLALEQSRNFGRELRTEAVSLLKDLAGYDWCGIYRLEGATLVLDEFVGEATEHTHIPIGRGVCGAAVASNRNQVIPDVRQVENYLSCSLKTRSEIVILIHRDGLILGQIDIDGHQESAFDGSDEQFLEKVADLIGDRWSI